MHEDLIGLADRTWGWDDDYAHLARVGREAVLARASTPYARGVARDVVEARLVARLPRADPTLRPPRGDPRR